MRTRVGLFSVTLATSIVLAAASGAYALSGSGGGHGYPTARHCTVPAQATTPSSSSIHPFTVPAQATTPVLSLVADITDA